MGKKEKQRTKKSEERSFELSKWHYAREWKNKIYAVAETNELAVKYATDTVKDEDLKLELIQRFHSMLYKFMKLFVTGRPDVHNASQRAFLNLFGGYEAGMSESGYMKLASKCTIIFRQETPDDIYNQLVALFLQLLEDFNPKMSVGFTYYVDYFFKFHLKKYMVSRYYDALDYQYIDSEDISSYFLSEGSSKEDGEDYKKGAFDAGIFYEEDPAMLMDASVDITSETVSGHLRSLTTFERYILYLLTVKCMKRSEILQLFEFSHNKLTSIVNKIKKKLGHSLNGRGISLQTM